MCCYLKRSCVFLFLLLFFCKAIAQEKPKKHAITIALVGMQGWRGLTNINNLNTTFGDVGYPRLSSTMSLTEAGVGLWVNRFFALALNNTCRINKNSDMGFTTSLSGDGFDFLFGYNLLRSEKIKLYPYLGVGYQNLVIDIDPAFPATYANVLLRPTQVSVRTSVSNQPTGSIGIGFDYTIASLFDKRSKLALSIMGGYIYGGSGSWRVNDQLAISPNSSFSGLNARLGLQLFFKL